MADNFVCDQRVEMRIGDHRDFAVGRLKRGRRREFARLLAEIERKSMQIRTRRELVAMALGETFEAALMADRVPGLLMAVGGLRDDVALTLRESESLRVHRTGRVDKKLMAEFRRRRYRVKSDFAPQSADRGRGCATRMFQLIAMQA